MKLLIILGLPVELIEALIDLIVQISEHVVCLALRILFVTPAALRACAILTVCHFLY